MEIVSLLPEHWPAVKAIYEDGLSTGNASFQTSAPFYFPQSVQYEELSRKVSATGLCGSIAIRL